jgi:SAM-dependent methyltransferase
VFIDLPSIERPARFDLWVGYGQFCRMFLFPLAVARFRHLSTRDIFLAHVDGMDVDQACRIVGYPGCLRPSLVLDLWLQRLLQNTGASHSRFRADPASAPVRVPAAPDAQLVNLNRLRRKLQGWRRKGVCGHRQWINYARTNTYTDAATGEKARFVEDSLRACRPARVLDAGCNTGRFSLLAAGAGCHVVAVDSDHDSVYLLYRRSNEAGLNILPLCVNLAEPTPGMGFMGRERRSFLDRADFDCVMALALVHHLLVTARIPLPAIREMFCQLTSRWLLVEFVPLEDPMFQQLLALRKNLYGDFTRDVFEGEMQRSFRVIRQHKLTDSERIIYVMEKRRP